MTGDEIRIHFSKPTGMEKYKIWATKIGHCQNIAKRLPGAEKEMCMTFFNIHSGLLKVAEAKGKTVVNKKKYPQHSQQTVC